MKYKVNMKSAAESVRGQGVGSAYAEQVELIRAMDDKYDVFINRHMRADITHYHTINPTFFMSIPFAKAYGMAVGYVHFLPETVEQSLCLPRIAKKAFYRYMIAFYKRMDALVTVNPYFIERLELLGIDRRKVTYIPNYVSDVQFYPESAARKREIRMEYGLDPDRFTVVSAGQLQTRKGVFDFLEIAKRLPEMQFVWAGGFSFGKITDGYDEIHKALEDPPANVKFLGIVDRSRMNDIYNLGDVMFLASYEELFPMTILEAMNCRIPLLLRDIPIYKNILFDYYLRETDNDGFTDALLRLRDDPEYYKQAQESSWRGHEFYNRKHVSQMWDQFYSDVIAARAAGRLALSAAEREMARERRVAARAAARAEKERAKQGVTQ